MFEEVEIGSGISKIADMIKEAWKTADFTDVGILVGEKINEALEKIPWEKIRATSKKIAKSIATFLNGFLEGTDWELVGSTIGNGLNTALDFAYTFVTTFDWKKLGGAISGSINGAVNTIEWKKIGQTISGSIKGILDTLIQTVENTDWKKLGESIKECLVNIDYAGITSRLCELIGASLGGLGSFIGGLIGDGVRGAKKYFKKEIDACGGDVVAGILSGIVKALAGIGKWIYKNIFEPIIKGFKEAFGIHSPSTVMAEQGKYIIEGLLKGLLDNIGTVIAWFSKLPGNVRTALGNAKEWLVGKGKDAIEGIRNGYESVKESSFLSKAGNLKNEVFESVGNISAKLKEKGRDIVSGIKSGYEEKKYDIQSSVSGVAGLVSKGIGSLWSVGREAISSFINGFSSLHIPTPHFKKVGNVSIAGIDTPIPKIGVSWYASGGFPSVGEMFIARERGPELVGRMGSQSAVANNGQIIEGIKQGVISAIMEVYMATGGFSGGSGEKYPVFNIVVKTENDEVLARAVQRGNDKLDYRFNPSPA